MQGETGRPICAAAAVVWSLYWPVMVKKEQIPKVKLSIHRSIHVPILTYGQELCDVTERARCWIQVKEKSFFCRVAWYCLRERLRSSEKSCRSSKSNGLICVNAPWRWGHSYTVGGVSGTSHWEEKLGKIQDKLESSRSLKWSGSTLESSLKSRMKCLGRGKSGHPCSDCCLMTRYQISGKPFPICAVHFLYVACVLVGRHSTQ